MIERMNRDKKGSDMQFHYTLAYHENGLIKVEQQQIGNISLSFNPDDDKFYLTDLTDGDFKTVASGKSWRNIVSRANRL